MSALSQIQEGEIPSRLDEEQQAIRIGITREIGLVQRSLQGAMNMKIIEDDIQELKEQLQEKDLELDKLRTKVKYLEDKNNNLCIKLEAKDGEVKDLKERIRALEDEKKSLEQELASVQYKLKTVEDDVKKLTRSRESDEEKYTKLEEKFKTIQYTLDNVVEDLQTTKDENKKLNLEIKQVRHQSRYVDGAPAFKLPVPASEDTKAFANLGEMCLQIQAGFYNKILPDFFTPIISYTIATLKKDIDKLCETDAEKTQALKRWEDLKATLQLKEEDFEALNVLQDIYNRSLDTRPPNLSVKVLKESAKSLERQNILKGWISLQRVNRLIDIWKSLVVCAGEKA